jgi:hypothetical protein
MKWNILVCVLLTMATTCFGADKVERTYSLSEVARRNLDLKMRYLHKANQREWPFVANDTAREEAFSIMGAGWSPGSSLRTLPETDEIVVRHTPGGHKGFQLALHRLEAGIFERMYSMPPEALRQLKIKENKDDEWQDAFERMGVKWPKDSSIGYIVQIKKIRVWNTPENFKHLELALHKLYTSAGKQ